MNIVKNLILIIFSTIFSLYLLEVLFSFHKLYKVNETPELTKQAEDDDEGFDTRSKIEVFNDITSTEKEKFIFNYVFKEVYINRFNSYLDKKKLVPLAGKSHSKVIHCNENGNWSIYKSDRYGFNNNDKLWDNTNRKILYIGNSYTHGACVDYDFSLAGWSNKHFKNFSTLSLGSDGKGPIASLASLREYYPNELSHVIYFFYEGNDLSELKDEMKNEILLNYYKNETFLQNLKKEQEIIDKAWTKMFFDSSYNLKKSRLKRFIKLRFVREYLSKSKKLILFSQQSKRITKKDLKNFEEIVLKMKNFSESLNSKFSIVYLPSPARYFKPFNENAEYNYYDNIIDIFNRNDIDYLDVKSNLFGLSNDPKALFPRRKFNHYSAKTYGKIVELMKKSIILNH
ncbi:hypothetical protein ACIJYB_00645 [Candidatus Pelagibacter bacterium nBUS_44]|uniref:hypothetical protein n=1 Tax=Candidatus Pelagibacter bacterium nBUS_44 TaxID=3374195 RepID=UPI003EB7783F